MKKEQKKTKSISIRNPLRKLVHAGSPEYTGVCVGMDLYNRRV